MHVTKLQTINPFSQFHHRSSNKDLLYRKSRATYSLSLPLMVTSPVFAILIPFSPPIDFDPSLPCVIPKLPPELTAFPFSSSVMPKPSENRSDSSTALFPFAFSPSPAAASVVSPFCAAASCWASSPSFLAASPSARPG